MLLAPLAAPLAAMALSASAQPSGRAVEARTASVFAGACHFSGERTTAGREAVLAWHVERGAFAGVDLCDARAVLVVADDENLVDAPVARRAVLHLDASEPRARREALTAWVRARVPDLTPRLDVDAESDLRVDLDLVDGLETYAVVVAGRVELSGSALPDRACCKMPFQVWYEPFQPLVGRVVGRDEEFRVEHRDLGFVASRPGENAAFVGAFAGAGDGVGETAGALACAADRRGTR